VLTLFSSLDYDLQKFSSCIYKVRKKKKKKKRKKNNETQNEKLKNVRAIK
jgi:hypothetical protein